MKSSASRTIAPFFQPFVDGGVIVGVDVGAVTDPDELSEVDGDRGTVPMSPRRMKRIPDKAVQRELAAQLHKSKVIKQIKFVNRHGQVIDIM